MMWRTGVIYTDFSRNVATEIIDKLRILGVATIHEAMGRINLIHKEIKPICDGMS